ncbi:MAG: hypothetical protein J5511_01185 [Bacilli bacterium]|nr:hypothetical protein [Bacilli bacterium]
MKTWKKILLEAGIFTAVFALGAGTGFLSFYHKAEEKMPTIKNDAFTEPQVREETPTDKYLDGLVNGKALTASYVDLTISPVKEENRSLKRGLTDLDLGDINIKITDLDVSIADIDNIKVSADLNLQMGNLNLDASIGFFDNTIYLDCFDTHFSMHTDDITDVMDMLPTFGANIELPEEFSNLDFDELTNSLTTMEEVKTENEHYFLFNFSEDIAIKMLSDDEYHMIGVELPEVELMGMKISALTDIHPLAEDIETLVNPSTVEDAPHYIEFKPAFKLVNGIMDIVNSKQGRVELDLDINQKLEGQSSYEDMLDLNGTLDFDINDLKLAADLTLDYDNSSYNLKAGYQEETIFASLKNLNISIEKQSVLTLVDFISEKLSNNILDEASDKLGSLTDEIDLDKILTLVNDLPVFIHNFNLTETSLSLDIDTSYFDLDLGVISIEVTFDNEHVNSLSLTGLSYKSLQINASIELTDYVEVAFDKEQYVALDSAVSLISTVDNLIKQDKFGVSFVVTTDDGDETTKDLSAEGIFHFALRDKTETELENSLIGTKRTFDYGAGELTINDGDGYPHNIKVDAEPYTEEMDGKVLFSYGGTTETRTNARIDYATFDSLVEKVVGMFESEDPHVMEIFGGLMESMESNPISTILNSSNKADLIKFLDYDIITSLSVSDSEIEVGLSGAILGMDDINPLIKIHYSEDSLSKLEISNLNISGKSIYVALNILGFNQDTYDYYNLTEDSSYIDLSTISKLVEEALATSKYSYYHMKGTIDFELDSDFLNLLGSAMGNKTMNADVQINTYEGRTKVFAHMTNIPVLPVISVNYSTGLLGECSKDSYLMFDNLDNSAQGIGQTGIFHIYRYDKWYSWGNKTEEVKSKYETPYLLKNIMTVLLSDFLGFGDKILEKITNIESGGGQIHYEQIIKNYEYIKDATLKNSNYNNGTSTKVDSYSFSIDVGELAQNDDLQTLSVTVYAKDGKLCGINIDMAINPGVGMTLNLKMFLQDDCSETSHDDMGGGRISSMNAYAEAHANDKINGRA